MKQFILGLMMGVIFILAIFIKYNFYFNISEIEIKKETSIQIDSDGIHIIGDYINNTENKLSFIQIDYSIFDKNNNEIGICRYIGSDIVNNKNITFKASCISEYNSFDHYSIRKVIWS